MKTDPETIFNKSSQSMHIYFAKPVLVQTMPDHLLLSFSPSITFSSVY